MQQLCLLHATTHTAPGSTVTHLRVVVVGSLVVGQLQLAERDLLPHPVCSGVGRLRVHVHLVAWRRAARR